MQADLIIRGPLLDPVPAALLFNKMRRTTPGLNWYAPPLDFLPFRFSKVLSNFCRSKAPKDAFHSEDGVSKPSK